MADMKPGADKFIQLVSPYERQLYFLCLRMMGSAQDAEDCAQESLLKAFRAFEGFRGESKVSTWLYTIAARCCTDALRRRKDYLSLDTLREEGWDAQSLEPSPYLLMEEGERKRLLGLALSRLSPARRQALVLCDLQGFSYEEAAAALEWPLGTLKSRLNRARGELKTILQKDRELFSDGLRHNDERRESK